MLATLPKATELPLLGTPRLPSQAYKFWKFFRSTGKDGGTQGRLQSGWLIRLRDDTDKLAMYGTSVI